jgi:predicted nucleotidyltransferase
VPPRESDDGAWVSTSLWSLTFDSASILASSGFRQTVVGCIGVIASLSSEAEGIDAPEPGGDIGVAMTVTALGKHLKEVVHVVEPGAQIILYGSRARGDAQPDSDWDLLILLDGVVDLARERAIWHRLYPLELDLEEVLCPVVLSRQDWGSALYQAMPFHQNVDQDGLVL